MSEYDAHDASRTQSPAGAGVSGAFDAFRARRDGEREANEQFTPSWDEEPTVRFAAPPFGPPDAAGYGAPARGALTKRGRLRSVAILGTAALLVTGIVAGLYSAVDSGSGGPAAAGAAVSASPGAGTPTASAPAGRQQAGGRVVSLRLTVTAVEGDSFTAVTPAGASVKVLIVASTRFGTAARPFDRAALVPGAPVGVRGRRDPATGAVTAALIVALPGGAGTATAGSGA